MNNESFPPTTTEEDIEQQICIIKYNMSQCCDPEKYGELVDKLKEKTDQLKQLIIQNQIL